MTDYSPNWVYLTPSYVADGFFTAPFPNFILGCTLTNVVILLPSRGHKQGPDNQIRVLREYWEGRGNSKAHLLTVMTDVISRDESSHPATPSSTAPISPQSLEAPTTHSQAQASKEETRGG